ncbi:hypothetical protein ACKKBG_A04665 [Auxenochlorella protothecoides x Auxenochlorella symbiontica]
MEVHPLHTPCYCEENVCMLLNQLHDSHNVPWRDLAALFITSHTRLTPVWRQAASQHANGLVLWDYHVVALHRQREGDCLVWDMDSTLLLPCSWHAYRSAALFPSEAEVARFAPRVFRMVSGRALTSRFESDRSHMRSESGGWSAPPPPWPCFECAARGGGDPLTLEALLRVDADLGPGTKLLEQAASNQLPWEEVCGEAEATLAE